MQNTCCTRKNGKIYVDKIYKDIKYKFCDACIDNSPDYVAGYIVGGL